MNHNLPFWSVPAFSLRWLPATVCCSVTPAFALACCRLLQIMPCLQRSAARDCCFGGMVALWRDHCCWRERCCWRFDYLHSAVLAVAVDTYLRVIVHSIKGVDEVPLLIISANLLLLLLLLKGFRGSPVTPCQPPSVACPRFCCL